MKCPKDGAIMDEVSVDGTVLDVCPKCSGYWMDWGELRKVSNNRVTEFELVHRGKSGRLCPRCSKQMRKADLHSVIVEECECGLFFDKGEAEKVIGRDLAIKSTTQEQTIELTGEQLGELVSKGSVTAGTCRVTVRR